MKFSALIGCTILCIGLSSNYAFATATENTIKYKSTSNLFDNKTVIVKKKKLAANTKRVAAVKTPKQKYHEKLQKKLESKKKLASRFNLSLDTLLLLDVKGQKKYAWNKFYKKPKKCENFSNDSTMVSCSNFYARKKKEFEKIWRSI